MDATRDAPTTDSARELAVARAVEELVDAWRRGERAPAEATLARHPGLDDEGTIRLIFEEFCLREEAGLEVDPADFARRFPQHWPELEILLECRRLMEPAAAPAVLPLVGEEVADCRLVAELGRGALGRVFLAQQPALADRPVVAKVTPLGRGEHLSLARLQHMNIVPLYSARVLPDRGLQVLCMPYLGGATLAQVLDHLRPVEPARRSGAEVVAAIDAIAARLPVAPPPAPAPRLPVAPPAARGPFRRYLAGCSYVEAIAWVGVCIADGLQYAHDRQFVHMDIKPSNVLIADDGQPMLLDFHLAREPLAAGDPPPAHLGGTPGYMPAEQADAIDCVVQGRPIRAPLDGRADVFALGRLLDEALGGPPPADEAAPGAPLRRRNPEVPVGLADIVARCLRPRPADRYPDAAALAADLRRFLEGRPLRGVPNRSAVERWRNWRRRRPHGLTRGLVVVAAAVTATAAVALLWAAYLQRLHEVDAALAAGRDAMGRHQYAEASRSLRRGADLAADLPGFAAQRHALGNGLARARRLGKAEELHSLADALRFRGGIDSPAGDEARDLAGRCAARWRDRDALLSPAAEPADPATEARIRADLLELALAWASLRAGMAPRAEAAGREAIRILDEAEAALGPDAALARDRRIYAGQPSTEPDPSPPPDSGTAWGHFELGKSYLRSGDAGRAADQFGRGLGMRPQDFWLNFYDGVCAYRLGRFEAAVAAFRACVALAPGSAECYFNRALAHAALDEAELADADYTRALELDPALVAAWLNRGMLRSRRGRHDEAGRDLDRALAASPAGDARGVVHYDRALVALARGDRAAAREALDAAASCGHAAARDLRARLRRDAGGRD